MKIQTTASDQAFLEQQRMRLEALRRQLLQDERARLAADRTFQQDHGEEAIELEEDAQRSAENEIQDRLRALDNLRIAAVTRALEKIEDGSYGLSDISGRPIPKARLEAVPEAVLLVEEEAEKGRL
jgi:DnaK suppressor protein